MNKCLNCGKETPNKKYCCMPCYDVCRSETQSCVFLEVKGREDTDDVRPKADALSQFCDEQGLVSVYMNKYALDEYTRIELGLSLSQALKTVKILHKSLTEQHV